MRAHTPGEPPDWSVRASSLPCLTPTRLCLEISRRCPPVRRSSSRLEEQNRDQIRECGGSALCSDNCSKRFVMERRHGGGAVWCQVDYGMFGTAICGVCSVAADQPLHTVVSSPETRGRFEWQQRAESCADVFFYCRTRSCFGVLWRLLSMQCPVALTVITVTFCGFPKQEFEAVGNDVRDQKKAAGLFHPEAALRLLQSCPE